MGPDELPTNTLWALTLLRQIGREIAANAVMGIPQVREWRINRPRTAPAFVGGLEQMERFAYLAVRGVERLAGPVAGKSVVEFGPGDSLASGLTFLAAGAASYAAIDRFTPDYSSPTAKQWYLGVREHWSDAFPGRPWPTGLDPAAFPEGYADRVATIDGAVETADPDRPFDVVVSWLVGEYVDPAAFAGLTARLLAPGGRAVHRVDLGPHDSWVANEDPMTFLRLSPRTWSAMSSNRMVPNRARHHEFMAAFDDAGLVVECYDVQRFDDSAVDYDKLHRTFRTLPRPSLEIRDVTYVCSKPFG